MTAPAVSKPPPPARPFTRPDWRDRGIALLFALAGLALFLFRITDPAKLDFDETHYVPAVRTLIAFADLPNPEHPPLGKWLIAIGMAIFGDNPFGWRIMSALAGAALTGAGVMAARWLLGTRAAAVMTGILLLASPPLFIQSRIAMLDIFGLGFMMLAFWMLAAAGRGGFRARLPLVLGGLFLGLATACKWSAVPMVATAIGLYLVLRWRDRDRPRRAGEVTIVEGLLWLGPFAVLAYLATFLPYRLLQHGALPLGGIIPQQFEMLRLQSGHMAPHGYQSVWWQWVLSLRPIWYFYEPLDGSQRGVFMIGNPAISWGGLAALPVCLYDGARERGALLVVPLLWAASLIFFILIPKEVMFYYHYVPGLLLLCFAIAAVLDVHFWRQGNNFPVVLGIGLAVLLFLDFYPIISAAPLGGPQAFNRWMWLDSWR